MWLYEELKKDSHELKNSLEAHYDRISREVEGEKYRLQNEVEKLRARENKVAETQKSFDYKYEDIKLQQQELDSRSKHILRNVLIISSIFFSLGLLTGVNFF